MISGPGSAVRGAVHRTSLSGQVARLLEQYLDDNRLAPGDPLPAAKELAERFDVSVPVVREAIAELAGQGRLQRAQGRATVTRIPSATNLQAIFGATLAPATDRDHQLMELRRALRVEAVRTTTQRCAPADIDRLRAKLADWDGLPPNPELLRRADLGFQRTIAELSGNDLVLLTLDAVDAMLIKVDVTTWQRLLHGSEPVSRLIDDLGAVLASMLARKPRRAARLMHDHLDRQERAAINASG